MIPELSNSYSKTIQYFSGDIGGLPLMMRFLPLAIIVAGASKAIAIALQKRGTLCAFLASLTIILSPATINATWLINREAYSTPGRLYTAYAYFFLFFLSFLLRSRACQKISEFVALIMFYLLCILASQQVNALELKTDYETTFIKRIVERVEPLMPDPAATGSRPALVIVGNIPAFDASQHVRLPPRLGLSYILHTSALAPYAQIDVMNYYLGRQGVRKPSSSEQKAVIDESRNVQPWPSKQATFISPSKAIGVVLEKYRPGGSVTWHDKQQRP